VAPGTDTSVVLVYQSVYYGCDQDSGFRIGVFDTDTWDPIGTVHHNPVPPDVCWIETLDTRGNLAAVNFHASSTYLIELDSGVYTTLDVSGPASIVP
jgi:hypothetical protein